MCKFNLESNIIIQQQQQQQLQQSQQLQQDMQHQSFGQQPRGAINRIEGPLVTTKHEKQTLLTM